MKIVKLSPAFKDYIWGGTKLRDEYLKNCDLLRIAESWELSTHSAGQSCVSGGPDHGLSILDCVKKYGDEILGDNCKSFKDFPVLIKFIDAKKPLSVQVHPDDEYALKVEGEYGKTEMWYVMDCEEGSSLYYGLNCEVSKDEFLKRIKDDTVTEVLNEVKVKKGDVFFINAGTVHAIGAGILICEIQQNSNTTYRVYDYARKDDNGNLRELHIEKALEVSDLKPVDESTSCYNTNRFDAYEETMLADCKYFKTTKYSVNTEISLNIDKTSFASIIILDGKGCIKSGETLLHFSKADSIFVPANSGEINISGKCSFVLTKV